MHMYILGPILELVFDNLSQVWSQRSMHSRYTLPGWTRRTPAAASKSPHSVSVLLTRQSCRSQMRKSTSRCGGSPQPTHPMLSTWKKKGQRKIIVTASDSAIIWTSCRTHGLGPAAGYCRSSTAGDSIVLSNFAFTLVPTVVKGSCIISTLFNHRCKQIMVWD